jgi:TetR/AcrR family transcriptional regulator, cholesterol catabolism regulator
VPSKQNTTTPVGSRRRNGRSASPKKREQEIIDAAAEIFHRQGYSDTSVQNVADAVGILKGSLYYYIDSKDDLLYRVLLEVHDAAHTILEEVAAMDDLTPLQKLDAYVRLHVEYNTRNLTKIAVYYHDYKLLAPERRAEIRRQRKLYEDFVLRLIREAQEQGEVAADLDPAVLSYCLFGALNSVYTWWRPGGKVSAAQLADTLSRFVIAGVRTP